MLITDELRSTIISILSEGKIVSAEESPLYKTRSASDVKLISDKTAQDALETDQTSVRVMEKGIVPEEGQLVGVRLNINVLKNTGVPILTIHAATNKSGYKNNKGFYRGEAIAYRPAVTLKHVYFNVDQRGREAIASGKQNKFPMASVDGRFSNDTPNFDGIEIGFNPKNAHLFTDTNGRAIRYADEATLYAHRVYVRGNIEYYDAAQAPAKVGESPSSVKFESFDF